MHSVKNEGLNRLFEKFSNNRTDDVRPHAAVAGDAATLNGPIRVGSSSRDSAGSSSMRAPVSTMSPRAPSRDSSRDTSHVSSAIAAALAENESLEDAMMSVDDSDPMAEMLENHALKLAEEGRT